MKVIDLGWAVARITYNQNFKEICIMSPYGENESVCTANLRNGTW